MFVTTQTIAGFLEAVRNAFDQEGTLYLVGESSLVVEERRSFCNEIIIAAETARRHWTLFRAVVDDVASRLGFAVTIEHPGDVIPLPESTWRRSRLVTGFPDDSNPLRIRHFDPYATAIRFIARGDEPDYDLVIAFLEMEWVEMPVLLAEIRALLPRFSFETIQQDPAEFRRKLKGLIQMWRARPHIDSDEVALGPTDS